MKRFFPLICFLILLALAGSGSYGGSGGGSSSSISNGAEKIVSVTSAGCIEKQLNTTSVMVECAYEFGTNAGSGSPVTLVDYALPEDSYAFLEYKISSRDSVTSTTGSYTVRGMARRVGAAGADQPTGAAAADTHGTPLHDGPVSVSGNNVLVKVYNSSGTNLTYGVMRVWIVVVTNNT